MPAVRPVRSPEGAGASSTDSAKMVFLPGFVGRPCFQINKAGNWIAEGYLIRSIGEIEQARFDYFRFFHRKDAQSSENAHVECFRNAVLCVAANRLGQGLSATRIRCGSCYICACMSRQQRITRWRAIAWVPRRNEHLEGCVGQLLCAKRPRRFGRVCGASAGTVQRSQRPLNHNL